MEYSSTYKYTEVNREDLRGEKKMKPKRPMPKNRAKERARIEANHRRLDVYSEVGDERIFQEEVDKELNDPFYHVKSGGSSTAKKKNGK